MRRLLDAFLLQSAHRTRHSQAVETEIKSTEAKLQEVNSQVANLREKLEDLYAQVGDVASKMLRILNVI